MPTHLYKSPNVWNICASCCIDISNLILPPDIQDLPLTTHVECLEVRIIHGGDRPCLRSIKEALHDQCHVEAETSWISCVLCAFWSTLASDRRAYYEQAGNTGIQDLKTTLYIRCPLSFVGTCFPFPCHVFVFNRPFNSNGDNESS